MNFWMFCHCSFPPSALTSFSREAVKWKTPGYLEHVCVAVMGVLHHHRLGSRESVGDAVLVFVAYGLKKKNKSLDLLCSKPKPFPKTATKMNNLGNKKTPDVSS